MDPTISTFTPPDGIFSDPFLAASAPPIQDWDVAPFEPLHFKSSIFQADHQSNAFNQPIYPLAFQPAPNSNHHFFEDLKVNVSDFFSNPTEKYMYTEAAEFNLKEIFRDEINALQDYRKKFAFQPVPNPEGFNSPIHKLLGSISKKFLNNYKTIPAAEKINFRENFINQFVYHVIINQSNSTPIIEQPFFPCLEIALRTHLFNEIIELEKSEIDFIFSVNEKFPNDLFERETELESFLTKGGFFINPQPYFYNDIVPMNVLKASILSCASETNHLTLDSAEELILNTVKKLNLEKPSRTSLQFIYFLRQELTKTLISKQALLFKEQFNKTGNVSLADFNDASIKITSVSIGRQAFYGNDDLKCHMLVKTFGLCDENHFSFQTIRDQIEQEKLTQPTVPAPSMGFFSFLSRKPTHSPNPTQLLDNKLSTIEWAEDQWNQIIAPAPLQFAPHNDFSFDESLVPFIVDDEPLDQAETPPGLENDWEILELPARTENPIILDSTPVIEPPAIKTPRPLMPFPATPLTPPPLVPSLNSNRVIDLVLAKPEPVRIYATSSNIPLISYINIAFANCIIKAGNDLTVWKSLPPIVQKDALRHCSYLFNYSGKAEEIAVRLFITTIEMEKQLKRLENSYILKGAKTRLSSEFIDKGEALLKMYYSPKRDKFYQSLETLPKEALFYQYVYEMAIAAGVHIENWDHNFAENNWKRSTMIDLSIQALERCLHTDAP